MRAPQRIVFNTFIVYAKLIIVMVIGFVNVRLILGVLGETDYGIYSVVAGMVGMLAVMQSALSRASMRFMSYSLGSDDALQVRKTFNSIVILHIFLAIVIIAIIELGGYVMFEHLLDIPDNRIFEAKVIFHLMVVSAFVSTIAVPYDAVMNSHENLLALSLVDVFGVILKLAVAIYLTYSSSNLLILYGLAMLLIQIILRLIKQAYSVLKYPECKLGFKSYGDKPLIMSILNFSLWNLFGSIASVSVSQVRSILLNMFFGVSLNAANGIAMQATSQVNNLSTSMTRAINPQLIKSEGKGDRGKMLNLTEASTKFSIFLFALIAIPVIVETPYILKIWLKEVPDYTTIFVRLVLIGLMLDKLTFEITNAIRAVGNIKLNAIFESLIIVLNIPITYFLFKNGFPPYTVLIVNLSISILVIFERLYFGKRVAGISYNSFIVNGVLPALWPIMVVIGIELLIQLLIAEGMLRLVVVFIISSLLLTVFLLVFGLTKSEAKNLRNIFKFRDNSISFLNKK